MRTQSIRGVLAFVMLLAFMAAPALAQSVVKGKVVDQSGKPVEGATVTFEAQGTRAKRDVKTDKKGEFTQIGLASGAYTITATKDGVGTHVQNSQLSQGRPLELSFKLAPGGAGGDKAAAAALQALVGEAQAAAQAGNHDLAITKFSELTTKVPTCAECFTGLANAYAGKQDYTKAEEAYKQSLTLKETPEAYNGLANIYNSQKKFDLAAEATGKAAAMAASSPGGASAEAAYNQGVINFNAGKFAEAKANFESATKADPSFAPAFYQLGMTALNTGDFAGAASALETYLKVAPDGPKAAEVKASLPAIQAMLKK